MRIHYEIRGSKLKTRSGAQAAPRVGDNVYISGLARTVSSISWDEDGESDEFVQDVYIELV